MLTIGVLAIQGGFSEHAQALECFNVKTLLVTTADHLNKIDGLIIPGGESTSIGMTCQRYNLLQPLRDFVGSGRFPVWGVCAGLIMLSDRVLGQATDGDKPYQPLIGGLRVATHRNFFGPQSRSAIRVMDLTAAGAAAKLARELHFIRAPAIVQTGRGVEPLAELKAAKCVTAVRQGHLLGCVFHPEVSNDLSWTQYFLRMVHAAASSAACVHARDLAPLQQLKPSPQPAIPSSPAARLQSVKRAFPRFLQGGVIMDVVNAEQARIAEQAGACAVMALERIPADIRADGGVARMSDPLLINGVLGAVTIPVMAKSRIGHFGESRVLQALDVDCIDESEVLTMADTVHHIRKTQFAIPFVCGAEDLGSALRRIAEGAAMIRLKGNAGTGDVKNAVTHARMTFGAIRRLRSMDEDEVCVYAKRIQAPLELVLETRRLGRLPVVTFAAGGIATPADVILLMEMGCDGVFVGSGIFKSSHPAQRAVAMVSACTHWRDPRVVAKCSEGLGTAMVGLLLPGEKYALVGDDEPAARSTLSRSAGAAAADTPQPYRQLQAKLSKL